LAALQNENCSDRASKRENEAMAATVARRR